MPSRAAVAAMLVVLAVSWILNALAAPAFMTWMGDLIPRRIRGRYLAFRSRVSQVIRLLVVVALGVLLDAVISSGAPETAAAQPVLLWVICGIFVVAGVFGVVDILLFRRIRELRPSTRAAPAPAVSIVVPPPSARTPLRVAAFGGRYLASAVRQLLLDPLRDRLFRRYVCYGATIAFAMTVGGWYYWLNALENLGYSKLGANVVFLGVGAVSGILAASGWGRLIDRWGRRPVLMIATFGTMFSAMPWFFLTRHTPAPAFLVSWLNFLSRQVGAVVGRGDWLWVTADTPLGAYLGGAVACTIGGACWSGVNLAQVGVTLGFADGSGRSKYVAASAVLISIGGVLGGVVGGTVAQSLSHFHHQANPVVLGPFAWNNWHATFALSILSRVAGVMWLFGMEDPGAVRLRHVARVWRANAYNAVSTRMFYPLRVFGWRRSGRNGDRNGGKDGITSRERQ
jgi:MFS family permease